MKRNFFAVAALAAASALLPTVTLAAGDYSPAPAGARVDPDVEAGKAAIRARDWQAAIGAFSKVAATDPRNADAHSYLGFAYRKSGDFNTAFEHYTEALRLDPKHRGAHEYIGEAYLMKGDVAKAKEHLATLDRLCLFGCGEYNDLKKSIAEFEQKTR